MPLILHLGLGAFHRAHQADYVQDAEGWSIEAVSTRDPTLADGLAARGHRYTLTERHPDGPRAKTIDAIVRTHALTRDRGAVLSRLADPEIALVTLTVTEKGYGADLSARALDAADPAVASDLRDGGTRSVPGLLAAGLARRATPLTIASCDNLPANGRLLESLVREMAEARGTPVDAHFPSTMVDRITPAPPRGSVDVETEPFRQWVIERAPGLPPGPEIVDDVAPWEDAKLRMLNGAHSLIAHLGLCAGLPAVRDVVAAHRAVVSTHMDAAARTLTGGPDPVAYRDALLDRFSNPAIDHRCLQIAADGSQKLPQRLLAPLGEAADRGHPLGTYALAVAAFVRAWREHKIADPHAGALRAAARSDDPLAALAALPGLARRETLARPVVAEAVRTSLAAFRHGPEAAARAALA
ncbi:mannitol dehydrogenase family protein [Jannaschia sp. Os4]|uniref:mannitol dehydrogenase family protein n=1 Tax=Jannaschia sp. Os4 TaxID=2807617 RepID=UPI00193A1984|nr:mannitol dehydrogenase family protein [Jannaschia sp. Os4]MBM2576832.1 mannitol dehydrogenase family protein [Jannaschia sp. Os4]